MRCGPALADGGPTRTGLPSETMLVVDKVVHLKIPAGEGRTLEVDATVLDTQESHHTGKPLRELQSELAVPAEEADVIRALLETPELLDATGDSWSGRIVTESYRDVNGTHALTLQWNERENLKADVVEFEGLELRPVRYEERTEEVGIALSFRSPLTDAETETLRLLQRRPLEDGIYFSVVRRGVSDEPRQMRFGLVLWQPLEDGGTEQQITLVDQVVDESPLKFPRTLGGEPALGRVLSAAENLAAERDALFDILKENGLLDEAGLERIRHAGDEAIGESRYRFYQVTDLPEWD
jgi:hypothetical protein